MKQLLIIIGILLFTIGIYAQSSINNVLEEIEKNNKSLISLRSQVEADKLSNKTGIYLQNPQININYLHEKPDISGPRTDFSIVQGFDFPSSYRHRNQIASMRNEQLELTFEKERKSVLLQARLMCFDVIYSNAILSELNKNKDYLRTYAQLTKVKFEKGEVSILENNKAQMNLLAVQSEIELKKLERDNKLAELRTLNGGQSISFNDSTFTFPEIPADFDQWYAEALQHNPILIWLNQEVEISKKQEQLNRSMTLPKFQAGYMSESIIGQDYNGVTVGVSIPLWENKNMVKYAKANELAIENYAIENQNKIYNELKRLHNGAVRLYKITENYKVTLSELDNTELLKKSLDQGEISILQYTYEMSTYYQYYYQLIELERDLNKAVAELNKYM